jgi:hypothetical protein
MMHCYLFGLLSLLCGKIIIPLMQCIFYKHVNVLPCNSLKLLLFLIQYLYQEKYENLLIRLDNCYLI